MNRKTLRTWGLPALLGLVSIVGLLAALLFDRWGDRVSWIALAGVAAVSVWICARGFAPGGRNGGETGGRRK